MTDMNHLESELYAAEQKVMEDRDEAYMDPEVFFEALGGIWGGLLSAHMGVRVEPLPGSLVCTMMASLKCLRSASSGCDMDHYIDIRRYATLSLRCKTQEGNS